MTDSTDPCTRCGAPYLEGRVCAGSNYTLPCNEPVSTGPVAMTQYVSCEFCGRPKSNTQHTPPVCPGIHTCRDLLFDRAKAAESALAAMTARAEAAETNASDAWQSLEKEKAARVAAEVELVHLREGARLFRSLVRSECAPNADCRSWYDRDKSLPSTRLDGGKVMAVEGEPCGVRLTEMRRCMREKGHDGNHLDSDDTAWKWSMAAGCYVRPEADPPPEPAWYVVEDDGSYSECSTEREAKQLLKCATEGAYITREKPPEPAPAGFAVGDRVRWKVTGRIHTVTDDNLAWTLAQGSRIELAPQPAAAPKVLPVEELRREIAKAARRASHRGYIRDDGQNALQALAEELERGGEGKGNV